MFTLRFDMRAPGIGAPTSELYAAAIEMCAWAETRGAILAVPPDMAWLYLEHAVMAAEKAREFDAAGAE